VVVPISFEADDERRWSVDATPARIAVRQTTVYTLVRIDGEMDVSNSSLVQSVFADAVSAAGSLLVADLSDVAFIDSSSISLLLTIARELEHRRWTFRVVAPSGSQVRRVLDLMGIGGASIADDLAAALATNH
jgi:anti-anti-sigma factor